MILEAPSARRRREFLEAVRRSKTLHHPWVYPPSNDERFHAYLRRCRDGLTIGSFAVLGDTRELVGVANLSEVVRGHLQSAFLGYYAFAPHAGRGLMTEALGLVIDRAFGPIQLHRIEANVQPGNTASKRVLEHLGFRCEGFSPRYLKVGGRWRDHERWALLAEDWKRSR